MKVTLGSIGEEKDIEPTEEIDKTSSIPTKT